MDNFLHKVLLAHLTPNLGRKCTICHINVQRVLENVSAKGLFPSHLQFGYYSYFFLN